MLLVPFFSIARLYHQAWVNNMINDSNEQRVQWIKLQQEICTDKYKANINIFLLTVILTPWRNCIFMKRVERKIITQKKRIFLDKNRLSLSLHRTGFPKGQIIRVCWYTWCRNLNCSIKFIPCVGTEAPLLVVYMRDCLENISHGYHKMMSQKLDF